MKKAGPSGYTILEVMIFLAITGLLFVSAIVAVGGNQQKVQYSQTVRDFEVQIKDAINDVDDGYYPSYSVGSCHKDIADTTQIVLDETTTVAPGTNQDCINIGKIMMFNLASNNGTFGLGTITAVSPTVGDTIGSFDQMNPILAYNGIVGPGSIDLSTTKPIRYGAVVTKIGDKSNTNNYYDSLSVINNFSSGTSGGEYKNGVLVSSIYGHISTGILSLNTVKSDFISHITDLTNLPGEYHVNKEFYICLLTPDDKIARIFVGIGGVPTATSTEYDLEVGGDCPG